MARNSWPKHFSGINNKRNKKRWHRILRCSLSNNVILETSSIIFTDTFHNGNSQVTESHMNHIVAQRDQLLEILIQKDIAIKQLLSKAKDWPTHQRLDAITNSQKEIDLATPATGKCAESVKDNLSDKDARIQNNSITQLSHAKIKCENLNFKCCSLKDITKSFENQNENQIFSTMRCEHLSLECGLLKGLNKSLQNEVENLKTVNKILQNNFDTLNGRLERVQSDHQLRLEQLYDASRLREKSIEVASTKKRARSSCDSLTSFESKNKRHRLMAIETTSNKDTEDNSSVNDSDCDEDEIDESDHIEDSDDDAEDDVVFVE